MAIFSTIHAKGNPNVLYGSGTLISHNNVLTAAHCLGNLTASDITAVVSDANTNVSTQNTWKDNWTIFAPGNKIF